MKKIVLDNELEIPSIGLGTYPMNGEVLIDTVLAAVKLGYSHFDTAAAYRNEEALGVAIQRSGKSREEFFITTKLSNAQQRKGDVKQALQETLNYLKMSYVDLYLMHWPNPETYLESWKQMEELVYLGMVRSIGVSNFHAHHLETLLEIANIKPSVNQIELHPLLNQNNLVEYCKDLGIQVEAYSPFARMNEKLTDLPLLRKLSSKYNKSVPQIILRWNFEHGRIVIPKTQNKQRLKENIDIFDFSLTPDELKDINDLNVNFRVRHNPDTCDFSKL